jgi:DNA-binding transcriptional ArsR family regulator
VDYTLSKLTNAESKVWFILFRDVKSTGIARTGEADLARRAGLSERMVRYAVKSLTEKELVTVVRRGRLNSGPSAYRVHPTGNT